MPKKNEVKSADLHEKLAQLRKETSDFRRALAANELPNPRVIASTRKEIARTLTSINAEKQTPSSDGAEREKSDV
ncbi:MAG: 50S ribosomal protein L29 [Candidatus Saccharimonadales bacterium]